MPVIKYKFQFKDGKEVSFAVDLERNKGKDPLSYDEGPEWTQLEFQKCDVCPLTPSQSKRCPAAVDVQQAMQVFHDVLSTEMVKVFVETQDRTYYKECDAQTGLKAMVGLVMATSACPILTKFKGLAYYHLPFASLEESAFRSISSYLIKQLFYSKEGKNPDWNMEKYQEFYEQMQQVNQFFFERIKVASKADANLNTIVAFSSLTILLSLSLDEYLENLHKQFFD